MFSLACQTILLHLPKGRMRSFPSHGKRDSARAYRQELANARLSSLDRKMPIVQGLDKKVQNWCATTVQRIAASAATADADVTCIVHHITQRLSQLGTCNTIGGMQTSCSLTLPDHVFIAFVEKRHNLLTGLGFQLCAISRNFDFFVVVPRISDTFGTLERDPPDR